MFNEFLRYADYHTVSEWNRAVRVCESLAIIGWGEKEALEALRDMYVNGLPNTYFLNADGKTRFVDAVWSKKKNGLSIDSSSTSFHSSPDDTFLRPTKNSGYGSYSMVEDIKLQSQRNWIPKNPIRIVRTLDNCYSNTRPLIESIDNDLQPMLNNRMRPECYGTALNLIYLNCAFSFDDGPNCKTNYIILQENMSLKHNEFYAELLNMFTEEEINDKAYYLRPRYNIGSLRKDTGCVNVTIVFEKEFSDMPVAEQKKMMGEYLITSVERIANRQKNKLEYNFTLFINDFKTILYDWNKL